jgi:peptidoglycan biosynthesis protein MviN/MurJ (putative lipid II flippase)
MFGGWVSMICTIIFSLFAIGSVILHEYNDGAIQIALAIISIIALRVFLKKANIFDHNSEHQ